MAQTTSRAYSAGKFLLELEGEVAGFLLSVEGGEAYATVVTERVDDNGVVPKHPGPVQFAPIQMSFGVGMSKEFYRWVGAMLERQGSAKSGAIIFADFNYREVSRRTFDKAVITEVTFPKLDGGSKDAASMSITIQPESTGISTAATGSAVSVFTTKSRPKWLRSNFRLTIADLETACRRVATVEPIVVKQPVARDGEKLSVGVVDIANLVITFPESSSDEFSAWFNNLVVKGAADERTGSIELLDSGLKKALFTLTLSNLGIMRVRKERHENNAETIARITVELYCETMAFQRGLGVSR